jgi:CBS domain-containing protein
MTQIKQIAARDVMRRNVATLSPDDTIREALEMFEDARISGAPVVDEAGAMVGVLTLTDIARTDHLDGNRLSVQRGTFEMAEPTGDELTDEIDPDEAILIKEDYSASLRGGEVVGQWMTRNVITVEPDASLEKACSAMVANQVHRVFVTHGQQLLGVITSFDIVRVLAGRAPERRSAQPRKRSTKS